LVFFAYACGNGDSNSTPGGTGGDNGGATGGSGGATGGGSGTGGSGTGGGGPGGPYDRIPGTDNYDCTAPTGDVPPLRLENVASGFSTLVLVTHAPNDTERLFAVELNGTISVVKDGVSTPFLTLGAKVNRQFDEQGLLGLAFHPEYEENGLFYVHYSAGADAETDDVARGDTIIEEYRVSSDPDVADDTSGRVVLHVSQPDNNHNGGTIAFGTDGYLYIALGDGGSYNDMFQNAQDTSSLLGKILRIYPRPSGEDQYSTPADNLIQDLPSAAPEIWDYGLRNPYRMNFDACTGALFIGDVGQSTREEVNREAAGAGRRNYGWPLMEGTHCHNVCDDSLTEPILEYPYASGASVIGGAVYRGTAIPALRGTYFYGDIRGRVWSATETGGTWTAVDRTDELNPDGVFSIQNGGDGEVYISGMNSIRRLVVDQ
jgi:glucose/arabinose dehydrogenase